MTIKAQTGPGGMNEHPLSSRSYSRAQRAALERPALLAEECSHMRYFTETALGTVVLTINTGYE